MSKMTSAFWGLRLEPGKRYSTTVDKAFHVSMAALDASTIKKDNDVHSVMLEEGESAVPFILCNLQKPNILQQRLSLNFESGDRITFFCKGTGTIHLTGYVIPEDDGFGMMGEEGEEEEDEEEEGEEEEEEEEIEEKQLLKKKGKVNGLPAKRKGQDGSALPAKKKKPAQEDSEEDSDDDDSDDIDELAGSDEELAMLSGEDDEDDDDSGDEEEKTSPAQPSPPQSQGKKEKQKKGKGEGGTPTDNKQQQKKKQTPVSNEGQQGKGAEGKQGAQPGGKKTIEGGVTIQDIKVGSGPICKPGRLASVYYVGRLKSTNKVFDQTSQGPGMKFRVGRGEVIKGWDVGLTGMKVGGKRIITCPPNMAYGQKGMPPTIPGNSTLVFEVELKNVN